MTANVLLLSGGPHPFAQTTPILAGLIEKAAGAVRVIEDPDALASRLGTDTVDLVVCNTLRWQMLSERHAPQRPSHAYCTPPATRAAIDHWVRTGGRLLALHAAPVCFDDWPEWGELLGARWDWSRSTHPPVSAMTVTVAAAEHLLVCGLAEFVITDECYGFLDQTTPIEPLLTGAHGGSVHPLLWERRVDRGHVVVSLLGHGPESFTHPVHQELLRRSIQYLLGSSRDADQPL